MKSQPAYPSAVTARIPYRHQVGRASALFCLLLIAASLFSGCERMKQYSLDSWQGPLPVHDLRYVQSDP
jgi:hypothetical protein